MDVSPVIQLSQELIQRESITPNDQGCQLVLANLLTQAGFTCEHKKFAEVDNLLAWHGEKPGKSLLFLGHTDVVPTGNYKLWKHHPFSATIDSKYLHGRGAADMKAAVAAFTLASIDFAKENPDHSGKIAIMLTSDEEGIAENGVKKMMPYVSQKHRFDYCIVGEPSSSNILGDVVRIGRRGSLHVVITVHGKQGHVAYPDLANNPVFLATDFIKDLSTKSWDQGNIDFPPTSFQISSVKTSSNTSNIIPADLIIQANFRFSPESTEASLNNQLIQLLNHHLLNYSLKWDLSGQPFHNTNNVLKNAINEAILDITQVKTEFNTAGGTSDGRFIALHGVNVVELGVINKTIHQIDECVLMQDVEQLQKIYHRLMATLL